MGFEDLVREHLTDIHRGKNTHFPLADLFRQPVWGRLAGYDVSEVQSVVARKPKGEFLAERGFSNMRTVRLFTLCFLLAAALAGQDYRGSLLGRITDATGAVVPGVSITVVNEGTNVPSTTRSNEEGNYLVPLLEPGNYTISVESQGFKLSLIHISEPTRPY